MNKLSSFINTSLRLIGLTFLTVALLSSLVRGETDLKDIPMDKVAAIQITAPDSSLSPEIRGLSNKWGGVWYDSVYTSSTSTVQSVLIIKEIKKNEAGVYEIPVHYFWSKTYKSPPGDRPMVGYIEGGKLFLDMPPIGRAEFSLRGSKLKGKLNNSFITMTPLQ
jgi:hypothetical protein